MHLKNIEEQKSKFESTINQKREEKRLAEEKKKKKLKRRNLLRKNVRLKKNGFRKSVCARTRKRPIVRNWPGSRQSLILVVNLVPVEVRLVELR